MGSKITLTILDREDPANRREFDMHVDGISGAKTKEYSQWVEELEQLNASGEYLFYIAVKQQGHNRLFRVESHPVEFPEGIKLASSDECLDHLNWPIPDLVELKLIYG
jgi:hypothetical protein